MNLFIVLNIFSFVVVSRNKMVELIRNTEYMLKIIMYIIIIFKIYYVIFLIHRTFNFVF